MPYKRDDQLTLNVSSPRRSKESLGHVEEPPDEQIFLDNEYYTRYPNAWSRIREAIREPMAEFFGVFIMIAVGAGVDCQAVTSANKNVAATPKGDWMSISIGWACSVALGVWFSAGVSGGHLNPAITIALATFRGFPWRKVPGYIFAQLMGALCGAGVAYANYIHAIDIYEGGRHIRTVPGTASMFSTYALDYMTDVSAVFDEFLGTVTLLLVVCAVTDPRNGPLQPGMLPIAMFMTILVEGLGFGMQTGYALNPARDLGPRMLTAMVGYGKDVFTFRHQYWLWAAVITPIVIGAFLYDLFFYTGLESPLNRPCAAALRAYQRAKEVQRHRPITGADAV
ncbi:hypothetical protein NM688_g7800 [Phlebia brevispora]|uniref:Uncharacterized protein n=1 Tax=Phlebia brevispora TaxID=194682 RepID=A0ACC1S102_9APHY|nr:hypothetical protein NM688_g7800 [Phlebia brevispora]